MKKIYKKICIKKNWHAILIKNGGFDLVIAILRIKTKLYVKNSINKLKIRKNVGKI